MSRHLAVMTAKSEVARAGLEVCDLAMEVIGGSGYFKGSVVERCYRDIRAVKFHPLARRTRSSRLGRRALGAPRGLPQSDPRPATTPAAGRRPPAWCGRRCATAVTVVCTLDGRVPVGHTIGSFVSASLHPPLVGYFAMRSSATLRVVRRTGVFSVNVLGEHQVELARVFAGPAR